MVRMPTTPEQQVPRSEGWTAASRQAIQTSALMPRCPRGTRSAIAQSIDFENLAPSKTYQIFLDRDGGAGGPWDLLSSFTTNESGVGEFDYGPLTFAPGTDLNYSFWANEDGLTALKTDVDLSYTTHQGGNVLRVLRRGGKP